MPAAKTEVRFRLIRGDDRPATNPLRHAYDFGLQDDKQVIVPGEHGADGALVWDFSLTLRDGRERPNFTGRFASGPADDRFVYLSWRSRVTGAYINRFKARLSNITWPLVRAALAADAPITADVSGRGPRQAMQPVDWRVADEP